MLDLDENQQKVLALVVGTGVTAGLTWFVKYLDNALLPRTHFAEFPIRSNGQNYLPYYTQSVDCSPSCTDKEGKCQYGGAGYSAFSTSVRRFFS